MSTTTTTTTPRPATGSWKIDPGHAEVAFIGRHFGLTKIRGRFTGVDGTITIADHIERSTVDVTIDMATVDSGSSDRDDHLRSADLFAVEEHPQAQFRSTAIDTVDGVAGTVTGDLTLKGVTKSVTLDVSYLGQTTDPWDNERLVFSATARINRHDWGVDWNMVLEAGGLVVSKEITLEIDVELVRT